MLSAFLGFATQLGGMVWRRSGQVIRARALKQLVHTSCLLMLFACGASTPNEPPAPDTQAHPKPELTPVQDARPGPMIQATLTGPQAPQPGSSLTLHARIDRLRATRGAVTIDLVLPDGVQLLEGKASLTLPANSAPRSDTLRYVIQADALPDGDVKLRVHFGGPGFGYHSEPSYRFGRAAPPPGLPVLRTGKELRVGDKSFGRAVDITPR